MAGKKGASGTWRRTPGPTMQAVLDTLRRDGPQTRAEVQRKLGLTKSSASCTFVRLHNRWQLIHVWAYLPARAGACHDVAPIYAFGPGKDAVYEPVSNAVSLRRWKAKKRKKESMVASVFDYAKQLAKKAA